MCSVYTIIYVYIKLFPCIYNYTDILCVSTCYQRQGLWLALLCSKVNVNKTAIVGGSIICTFSTFTRYGTKKEPEVIKNFPWN